MSSSDSDAYSRSSDEVTGWPWEIGSRKKSESDEFDSSSEDSSDQSSVDETTNDSWTNRRNIFISVYNTNNYKDITLITNYNELHNYREKYTKLSKKNAENIKNIWSEVKINVPDLGIVPLKSYEKELIEDPKTKNKTVKKPIAVSKQNGIVADRIKASVVTQSQSSKAAPKSSGSQQVTIKVDSQVNKNTKENSSNVKTKNNENVFNQKKPTETATKLAKSIEENKTSAVSTFTKAAKQDKGVKIDIVVTKSESDKKSKTNSTTQVNGSNKNIKSNSHVQEFKKPQAKSDPKKNKNSKNNTKEIISETKSKKRKPRNSSSQSSENSDVNKRSSSVDSHSTLKGKSKKKTEESDNDTSDSEDEDEEIIDNMDELTGNSKTMKISRVKDEMLELVKYKDKLRSVETPKVAEKKTNEKDIDEQDADDIDLSISERNNIYNSEKFAEASIDMLMDNNLTEGLDSLMEAMQCNPGDDRHYLNRSYFYLLMNKPSLALADAQYVLQTGSHHGHRFIAYLRAGKASMALQKYTQAENYFKDSLSINSDNAYAQRELVRAKIARIVSLGYTEKNAVLALLKYSKTQDAINHLANKNIAKLDNNDDVEDSDDLVYSSDVDEKPNCTSLINNMLNYEPIKTKLFHLIAKPTNMATTTTLPPIKTLIVENKKKNTTNSKTSTGQILDKTLWVGSLTKSMTEAVLKKKFQQYGNVVSVYCPPNEAYAFVNFEKGEHVTNVLQHPSAHEIYGHKILIRQGMHKK